MKPIKLIVKTKTQKYPILIGENLILNFAKILKNNSIKFEKCLLVIDKNVPSKNINKLKRSLKSKNISIHLIKVNEKNKNQKSVDTILEILFKKNFSRQDCIISVGGGISGDIVGFSASLFKRGIQFINIPTTLLSQVDSSIGGKTGINTNYGKNLIGSFYQPKLVVSDSDFLKTLPKRELICGYGEILKHALIANKKFYNYLDKNFFKIIRLKTPFIENAIYGSCKIKRHVVQKDENEKNLRKVLNFGHTFGHAFEASLGFSKRLNHGEAVILGMNVALKFSKKNKILNEDEYLKINNHYNLAQLSNNIKKYFSLKDLNKIVSFMSKDKKNNSSKINLVLLKKIGSPVINYQVVKKQIKTFLKNELIN